MHVDMLDNGDTTADSYAVARLQSSLVFAPVVPFLAPARQEIQPSLVESRVLSPERDAAAVVSEEHVAAVRNQRLEPDLDFRQRDWQSLTWQMQGLRVRELRSPSVLVLHHPAPEQNLAANAAIPEAHALQGIEALASVHAAPAVGSGNGVGRMCWETDKPSSA